MRIRYSEVSVRRSVCGVGEQEKEQEKVVE